MNNSKLPQNHWHPCCQETPDVPIDNHRVHMKLLSSKPITGEKNTVLKTAVSYTHLTLPTSDLV